LEIKADNFYQKIIFIPREKRNMAIALISSDESGMIFLEKMLNDFKFTD
jgi:hypothetical protein